MPPTTTSASGRCTCDPIPLENAAGNRPTQATMQVIITGLSWVRQVCSMALARSSPDSRLRWQLPIILMTGHRDAELDARASEVGIAEILDKPLRVQTLREALARQLRSGKNASNAG